MDAAFSLPTQLGASEHSLTKKTVKTNRISPWYQFAAMAHKYAPHEAIWSRTRCYTWQQAHDRAIQWAHFFLSKGVKPGDLVATYLMNSAEYLVFWLGLWCIGCA